MCRWDREAARLSRVADRVVSVRGCSMRSLGVSLLLSSRRAWSVVVCDRELARRDHCRRRRHAPLNAPEKSHVMSSRGCQCGINFCSQSAMYKES